MTIRHINIAYLNFKEFDKRVYDAFRRFHFVKLGLYSLGNATERRICYP